MQLEQLNMNETIVAKSDGTPPYNNEPSTSAPIVNEVQGKNTGEHFL